MVEIWDAWIGLTLVAFIGLVISFMVWCYEWQGNILAFSFICNLMGVVMAGSAIEAGFSPLAAVLAVIANLVMIMFQVRRFNTMAHPQEAPS